MKRTPHTQEFREQALRKVRARGQRTQQSIAQELNISLATLKGWLQASGTPARVLPHGATPLPGDLPAAQWSPSQRLQALNESHALSGEALHGDIKRSEIQHVIYQRGRAAYVDHTAGLPSGNFANQIKRLLSVRLKPTHLLCGSRCVNAVPMRFAIHYKAPEISILHLTRINTTA